jgi:heme exporter protein B
MATVVSDFVSEAGAVFVKDTLSELRSKVAISGVLLFAATALALVSFSTGKLAGVPETLKASLKSALLWIVLFFSAMSGLARVFVKEEDTRTAAALRLCARPTVVYAGKLLFNIVLLAAVAVVVVPAFVALMEPAIARWDLFLGTVLAAVIGLAGAATIVAAIVAKASTRGSLFVVLAFPLLLPLLVSAVNGSRGAMIGATRVAESQAHLVVLACYTVAMITASLMLFPFVWEE